MARSKKKRLVKTSVPRQIAELETAIAGVRNNRKPGPRTARLISSGLPRMAKKVAEEATEVVIEAVRGRRTAVVKESVDLLDNLVVLWSELGIAASESWASRMSTSSTSMTKICRSARKPIMRNVFVIYLDIWR